MKKIEFSGSFCCIDLFRGLCLDNYNWYIYEDEIVVGQEQKKINGHILADDLNSLLSDSNVSIIFMNLQAFPKETSEERVWNRSDFLLSECSFVVMVTDASYFEIYTKSNDDFMFFLRNAKAHNAKNIEIKSRATDGRKRFSII